MYFSKKGNSVLLAIGHDVVVCFAVCFACAVGDKAVGWRNVAGVVDMHAVVRPDFVDIEMGMYDMSFDGRCVLWK